MADNLKDEDMQNKDFDYHIELEDLRKENEDTLDKKQEARKKPKKIVQDEKKVKKNVKPKRKVKKHIKIIKKKIEINKRKKEHKKMETKTSKKYLWFIIISLIVILIVGAVKFDIIGKIKGATANNNLVFDYNGKEIVVTKAMIDKEFKVYDVLTSLTNPLMPNSFTDEEKMNITKIEMLLLFYANDNNLKLSDEEFNGFLANMSEVIDHDELVKALNEKSLIENDFNNYIKIKLTIKKAVEDIVNKVNISDDEIKSYYDENPEMFNFEIYNMSHILVCYNGSYSCESNITKEEAKGLIDKIYQETTVKNFAEKAEQYSEDPGSKDNGGNMGEVNLNLLIPSFSDVVRNLSVNTLSKPFETEFGYHLAVVFSKNSTVISFKDAESFIKQTLAQEQLQLLIENTITGLEEKYLVK